MHRTTASEVPPEEFKNSQILDQEESIFPYFKDCQFHNHKDIFNSVLCWTVTFQPISIKTLAIYYVVHSAHVPVISCIILLLLFDLLLFDCFSSFVHLLFDFCFHLFLLLFSLFIVHCSLFVVHEKIFNSDPGLYSRYFDPVSGYTSPSMQVK
jgi:hypothetical protein